MLAQEVIRRKRDGHELTHKEISWFVMEMIRDQISEGQIAAFAMATFIKGMSVRERIDLTKSMRDSGRKLDWNLSGPIIDKHSTGGVGDCVSLLLAPALAACGGFVPMVSGRGLGHTGGTLDKFDSIPGYNTTPAVEVLKKVVSTVGCAIVGQTEEIAPADKRLYSVRDVTATVESIDLITASIMSKKLAAGLDALVLDIKFGSGAFMGSRSQAEKLAESLVNVGNGLDCKTTAILSDMNEPLCSSVGNALEIIKVVRILNGQEKEKRLLEVVCALGGKILFASGLASSSIKGRNMIKNAIGSGSAAEIFEKMVFALGGDKNFITNCTSLLPKAPIVQDVFPLSKGHVNSIDTREIGLAVLELGGARRRPQDKIDYSVGFENLLGVGDEVDIDVPLARVHASDNDTLELAKFKIRRAYKVSYSATSHRPTIIEYKR